MIFELSECEEIIGYKFKDLELFRQCFTHASYTNEHPWQKDNERLEFFGDKIIDFVVTEYLYQTFPEEDEGKLTERRKNIVSKEPLTEVVFSLGLNKYINLGRSLLNSADKNEKYYSSLYEAVVAGIYLDGGLSKAKDFILRTLIKAKSAVKGKSKKAGEPKKPVNQSITAVKVEAEPSLKDPKTELQEYIQKLQKGVIKYESIEKTGPDNAPTFTEAVLLNGKKIAEGKGKNKKAAQKEAAKAALSAIQKAEKNVKTERAVKKENSVKKDNSAKNANSVKTVKPVKNGNKAALNKKSEEAVSKKSTKTAAKKSAVKA